MAGVVLNLGKNHIRDIVFKAKAAGNLYLGLMQEGTLPSASAVLGSGITEIGGTGYARILITNNTDWTAVSTGVVSMAQKEFTVGAGGWSNVRGFFIADALTGGNVVMADVFAVGEQGNQGAGVIIKINATVSIV